MEGPNNNKKKSDNPTIKPNRELSKIIKKNMKKYKKKRKIILNDDQKKLKTNEFVKLVELEDPYKLWKKNFETIWKIKNGRTIPKNISTNIKRHLNLDTVTMRYYLNIFDGDHHDFYKFYRNLLNEIFTKNYDELRNKLEKEGIDLSKFMTEEQCQSNREGKNIQEKNEELNPETVIRKEREKTISHMIDEFESLVRSENPYELLKKDYETNEMEENIHHHLNIDKNILDHFVNHISDGKYQHFRIFYRNLLTKIICDKNIKNISITNNVQTQYQTISDVKIINSISTNYLDVNDTFCENLLFNDEFFECIDFLNLPDPHN